jgi:hypothetical protein
MTTNAVVITSHLAHRRLCSRAARYATVLYTIAALNGVAGRK